MPLETFPFDAADFLADAQSQAELLAEAFETGDAGAIANALGIVARARGMNAVDITGLPAALATPASEKLVVLSLNEYEQLVAAVGDLIASDREEARIGVGGDGLVAQAIVEAFLGGKDPIRAWQAWCAAMREAKLRPARLWVIDTSRPEVVAEIERQCRAIAAIRDPEEDAFLDELPDEAVEKAVRMALREIEQAVLSCEQDIDYL